MVDFNKFYVIVFLLFFATLSGCASNTKLTTYPECEGLGCSQKAALVSWPETGTTNNHPIRIERFEIELPSNPRNMIHHWDGDLSLTFENNKFISFTFSKTLVEENIKYPKNADYSIADSYEIIFEETIKSNRPRNKSDLWFWERAMFLKGEIFNGKNSILLAKKENLKIYFWESKAPGPEGGYFAWVFDSKRRDSYMRIFAQDMNFSDFKKIIGSIKTKDHY